MLAIKRTNVVQTIPTVKDGFDQSMQINVQNN